METTTLKTEKLQKFSELKHAEVLFDQATKSAIVRSKLNFIPFKNFQEIFGQVEELLKKHAVKKLIFDKTSLNVFDQPSMEWYYLDWKVRMMKNHGLKDHRKILPNDSFFKKSVDIGRGKILNSHPDHAIQQVNIRYYNSLQEALLD
jgi:hypothetical protein